MHKPKGACFVLCSTKFSSIMLEYCKTILSKVSFDPLLLQKELTKSLKWLNETEQQELIDWCKHTLNMTAEYLL